MDLKKLFMNNKAVSPVIGVILMVAITVILAAAIGSSVFGQGTAQSAPQANLDISAVSVYDDSPATAAIVKLEHLGGDPINFGDSAVTKVSVSLNDTSSVEVVATGLGVLNVGDVKNLNLVKTGATGNVPVVSGSKVNIKVVDVQTNQLIFDKDIRF